MALSAAIERSRLVSQSEKVVAGSELLNDAESVAIPPHGRGVLLQHAALPVAHSQTETVVHAHAERVRGESMRLACHRYSAGAGRGQHRPRSIFRHGIALPHAHAQNVIAQGGHLQRHSVRRDGHSVAGRRGLLANALAAARINAAKAMALWKVSDRFGMMLLDSPKRDSLR